MSIKFRNVHSGKFFFPNVLKNNEVILNRLLIYIYKVLILDFLHNE